MTITSTQTKHPASVNNVAVGRYLTDGTAAAYNINTGFKPRYVRVINLTDRNENEWLEGMADASALHTIADGTRTLTTTLGITPLDNGFTVGLDTDVNVTAKQISWIAIG